MNAVLEIPAFPPRGVLLNPPLCDEEFERLSAQCENALRERSKEGAILLSAPAGGMTSDGKSEIIAQLSNRWKQCRRGCAFDSSCGFFLSDGSHLSPDAGYGSAEQLAGITRCRLTQLLRLAPAFVLELIPESDRLSDAKAKMESRMADGVGLGLLVDPYPKQVHIYEAGTQLRIEKGSAASGSGPV
jgi:Uma2 family endonuclease